MKIPNDFVLIEFGLVAEIEKSIRKWFCRRNQQEEKEIRVDTLTKSDVQHKAMIVFVNKNWNGWNRDTLYSATNFAWGVRKERAEQAEIILASYGRKIVGVFIPEEWLEANLENFPGQGQTIRSKRYGYRGREADPEIQELYVGKWLSDELKGTGNGFRYVHC